MNITGRTALITGSASGLGAASARMIVDAGGRAVMVDVNQDAGRALEKELGGQATFVCADVTDATQMEAAIAAAGPLHMAINCAGVILSQRVIGKQGPSPLDAFTNTIRVNLIGTFNTIRLVAAAMAGNEPNEEGERGVIIMTASVAAYDGQIGQAAYSASKGGIVGMTLPLARDLCKLGIRVMAIAPGIFDTPMLAKLSEEARASLAASVPFPPRLGRPAEYARLARHIIESPMLNGEVIRLDGALRMAPK